MGVRVKRIKVKNIGVFENFDLSFDSNSLHVLVGANGSGKSTVLGIIRWLLTGDLPSKRETRDKFRRVVPPHDYPSPSTAKGWFDVNGVEVRIAGSLHTSDWTLKVGSADTIRGAKNVRAALTEVLGVDHDVFRRYAFVQQGELSNLLFETRAKRLDALLRLVGANNFESFRKTAGAVLGNIDAPDLSVELSAAERQMQESEAQLADVQRRLKTSQDVLVGLNFEAAMLVIQSKQEADRAAGALAAYREALAQADRRYVEATQKLAKRQEARGSLQIQLEQSRDDINSRRQWLQRVEVMRSNVRQREQLLLELGSHQQCCPVKPAEGEPVPHETVKVSRDSIGTLQAQQFALAGEIASLEKQEVGKCNVCGAECAACAAQHGEASAAAKAAKIARLGREINSLKEQQEEHRKYVTYWDDEVRRRQDAQNAYQQQLAVWSGQKQAIEARLASMPDIVLPDEQEIQTNRTKVESYDAGVATLQSIESELVSLEAEVQKYATELRTAQGGLSAAEAQIANMPSASQVQEAERTRALHTEHSAKVESLQQSVDSMHGVHQSHVANFWAMRSRQETNKRLRAFVQLLSDVRSVVHRDNLPALLVAEYMRILSARMNSLLPDLGGSFTTFTREDGIDLWVRKGDGTELEASTLSGGEATRLMIAFVLAVNQTFGSSLGILTLDEPTEFLDEAGKRDFVMLLAEFRRLMEATDTHVLMATHMPECRETCDGLVDISEARL